jgi:hypothetical protein
MNGKDQLLVVVVVLVAVYGASQWFRASTLDRKVHTLQTQQVPSQSADELVTERDEASQELAALSVELDQQRSRASDILRLRNEVTRIRRELRDRRSITPELLLQTHSANDGLSAATLKELLSGVALLQQKLEQAPEERVPELSLLEAHDWIKAARNFDHGNEVEISRTLGRARTLAKEKLVPMLSQALARFAQENEGRLPSSLADLKPYLSQDVEDSIFERYVLVKSGHTRDLRPGEPIIREKDRLSPYDSRCSVGIGGWGFSSPQANKGTNAPRR